MEYQMTNIKRRVLLATFILIMATLNIPATAGSKTNQPHKARTLSFVLKEQGRTQHLTVHYLTEHKLRFSLMISGQCRKTVSGIATSRPDSHEMPEDENGVMYPAKEFNYKGNNGHLVSMNIALDKTMAEIAEHQGRPGCPVRIRTMQRTTSPTP